MDINFMLFAFSVDEYSYQQEEVQGEQDSTPQLWRAPQRWKIFEHQHGPWEFKREHC